MSFTIQSVGTSAGASSSANCVITKPTGVVLGDILVAHINYYATGTATTGVTAPSGWNQVGIPVLNTGIMYVGWKVATATEVSASTFTFTATGGTPVYNFGKMIRLNGGRESNVAYVTSNASSGTGTGTAITVGTITPSVANSLLMFFMGGGAQSTSYSSEAIATSNPTWTEAYDDSYSANTGLACAYAVRPEVTATGNFTATQSFLVKWSALTLAIEPQIATTVSDTVTSTDSVLMGMSTIQSDTVTSTDEVTTNTSHTMTNGTKHSSVWTNQNKT